MKNIRKQKIIYIAILMMIIGTLSVGFALFSTSLNIKSQSNVKPSSSNFNLSISDSETEPSSSTIKASLYSASGVSRPSATNGIVSTSSNGFTITNIKANFSESGQRIDYKFYIHNIGKLDAYWKSYNLENIEAENKKIKCIAKEGTTDALVQEDCKNISTRVFYYYGDKLWGSINDLPNRIIEKNKYIGIEYSIVYSGSNAKADGPFDVEIGDLELIFSTTP